MVLNNTIYNYTSCKICSCRLPWTWPKNLKHFLMTILFHTLHFFCFMLSRIDSMPLIQKKMFIESPPDYLAFLEFSIWAVGSVVQSLLKNCIIYPLSSVIYLKYKRASCVLFLQPRKMHVESLKHWSCDRRSWPPLFVLWVFTSKVPQTK